MRRCGSTRNGKLPASWFTIAVAVRVGGSATGKTPGPPPTELNVGEKKADWKGDFPREVPTNCAGTTSQTTAPESESRRHRRETRPCYEATYSSQSPNC